MASLRAFKGAVEEALGAFYSTVAEDLRAFAGAAGEGPRIFLAPFIGAFRAARSEAQSQHTTVH